MSITIGMSGTLGRTSLISFIGGVSAGFYPTENIIDRAMAIGNTNTDCILQITSSGILILEFVFMALL
jgi:hypothetical protein